MKLETATTTATERNKSGNRFPRHLDLRGPPVISLLVRLPFRTLDYLTLEIFRGSPQILIFRMPGCLRAVRSHSSSLFEHHDGNGPLLIEWQGPPPLFPQEFCRHSRTTTQPSYVRAPRPPHRTGSFPCSCRRRNCQMISPSLNYQRVFTN